MAGRLLRGAAILFLVLQACVGSIEIGGDPRLGEDGRVRFVGGGCSASSSTAIAVGSTQPLTLEPQDGATLPTDLTAGSSASTVIDARGGATVEDVVLEAHAAGEADVELRSAGEVYDHLRFRAEPATSVKIEAGDAVFAGGTYLLKVTDVYGACGESCPLLGEGFLVWSAEPTTGFAALDDSGGVASFLAGPAGDARVQGREPSGGALLVDHPVRVVPVADAGSLDVTFIVMLPDETVLDPQPLPVEMPVGSLFLPQVQADAGGTTVPLAGADVDWTVEGDVGVVAPYPVDTGEPPEGPIFSAVAAGAVTLVADVPLLGLTGRFPVTVVPGS
jgi:hypothetical protein